MGAQMLREVASKTNDIAGDGTTTATVLAQAIVREGMKSVAAGMNPMDLKRGIDIAVTKVVEDLKSRSKAGYGQPGDRPGRHHLRQRRPRSRRDDRRGDGEGRQGRRHHRRGGQGPRDRAGRRRRHAVRPRLPVAVLHHQPREDAGRTDNPYILIHEKKLSNLQAMLPILEAVVQCGPSAADHRRGHRGRGARDAGRQQAARRPQGRGRQGAGLRRSPQGDARGHRDPHRRRDDQRRSRHQARERHARTCSAGQARHDRQGQHDDRRRRRSRKRESGPRGRDPPADREHDVATTTGRSCRSGWRSWPAALR